MVPRRRARSFELTERSEKAELRFEVSGFPALTVGGVSLSVPSGTPFDVHTIIVYMRRWTLADNSFTPWRIEHVSCIGTADGYKGTCTRSYTLDGAGLVYTWPIDTPEWLADEVMYRHAHNFE
jgi:hypothetical protein